MAKARPTAYQYMTDPMLFGRHFVSPSWDSWKTVCKAQFATPAMTPSELAFYRACTARSEAPTAACRELTLVCGRRSGKSRYAAFLACFYALQDYSQYLAAGEVATCAILASDRKQARAIFRYVSGFLRGHPLLADIVEVEGAETVKLRNRVVIEISTASFRGIRGYTFACLLCDEVALWRSDDSVNPDVEILRAAKPGLLTIPGAPLVLCSSPYAKQGELYARYKKSLGVADNRCLVWKASTIEMNSDADQEEITAAYENDPAAADAEYGGNFREDLIGYISAETLERITVSGRTHLLPESDITYTAFMDASSGISDSMTLAIGHREDTMAILDHMVEIKPPFNPDSAALEFATVCRNYRVARVVADHYAKGWVIARFAEHGIAVEMTKQARSDYYLNFLALANAGRVELLDSGRLRSQFTTLRRKVQSGGRDSVDHLRDTHDDLCNSVAGVLVNLDLDRTPSLVRQDKLVAPSGGGIEYPLSGGDNNCVVATVCVCKDGTSAVVYAMRHGHDSMLLLDADKGHFNRDFEDQASARLLALCNQIPQIHTSQFRKHPSGRPPSIPSHALMLINGMGSAARAASASPLVHLKCIDMDVQQLKAFVSVFTDASRVKLSQPLNDKLTKLALSGALEIRWAKDTEEDALRCAVITAVACTLMNESDIPKNAVLQGA